MTIITAILPAYNEEIAIGSIVLRSKKHVDNIIVIDDGSSDDTSKVAELAGAEVIKHDCNYGKGTALKTGFDAAPNSDIIITMDADGQHNPENIPELIKPIQNGEADIVNGSRYINGNGKETPSYRRVGQTVLDKATNMSGGLKITDTQSGFRAFANYTLNAFRFNCTGFGIESEMLIDAAKAGFNITEIEVRIRYDVNNSTKGPLKHGIEVLVNILNDIEFKRPLYYFTFPGIVITIVGLVLGINYLWEYIAGINSSLIPTILAILLTCSGGFLALTGILLDSMSKMLTKLTNERNNGLNKDKFNQLESIFYNKKIGK